VSRLRALKKVFMDHVSDMERDGGMFDEARRSIMDHEAIARLVRAHLSTGDGEQLKRSHR